MAFPALRLALVAVALRRVVDGCDCSCYLGTASTCVCGLEGTFRPEHGSGGDGSVAGCSTGCWAGHGDCSGNCCDDNYLGECCGGGHTKIAEMLEKAMLEKAWDDDEEGLRRRLERTIAETEARLAEERTRVRETEAQLAALRAVL